MGLLDSNRVLHMQSNCQFLKYFSRQRRTRADNEESTQALTSDVTISREIWMTFAFTLVVGAFLCGGGMYLVYSGTKNHVTDFVVLGSCGCLVGLCFSSVGSVILVKSNYDRRMQRGRTGCVTLVQRERNTLLTVSSTNIQGKPVKPQKSEKKASRTLKNAGNSATSKKNTTTKNKNDRMSASGNIYDNFPTTTTSVCDIITCRQHDVLLTTGNTQEKAFSAYNVDKKTSVIFGQSSQDGEMKQKLALARNAIFKKQTTVSWVSLDSISTNLSTDSCDTLHEPMTIVAEVHAQAGSSRSSLEFFSPIHHDWQYLHETNLPNFTSTSDEEDVLGNPLDMFAGDWGSRSDTGVGESVSEEDSPFINDDTSFSYRVNIMDNEISNDALMRIVINDPLIYSHRNDMENNYILNKCHAMSEVLVHSG